MPQELICALASRLAAVAAAAGSGLEKEAADCGDCSQPLRRQRVADCLRHAPRLAFLLAAIAPGQPLLKFSTGGDFTAPQGAQRSCRPGSREPITNLAQSLRRHLQRRRLYVKWAADRVDEKLMHAWRVLVPRRSCHTNERETLQDEGGCNIHNYHASLQSGCLLAPEVVACSYMPDAGLRAHTLRLLKDRWSSESQPLASIPEHDAPRHSGSWPSLAMQIAWRVHD